MKLKNYWKRFWTLDRHHAEGFTLVELIVVIAILAILAGVAIPVYSGYIKKAERSADEQLLAAVNTAFAAACATNGENHYGRNDVDATVVNGKLNYEAPYREDFEKFFDLGDDAKFNVFENIYYNSKLGVFLENIEMTFSYGNSTITVSSEDLAALGISSFINAEGMSAEALMGQVGSIVSFASAFGSGIYEELFADNGYMQFMCDMMGVDPSDYESINAAYDDAMINAYKGKVASLAGVSIENVTDEMIELYIEEAQNYVLANTAVLYSAHNAKQSSSDIMTILTGENPKQTIKSSLATSYGTGLTQASVAYGMYLAYAYSTGDKDAIANVDDGDYISVLNDLNNENFQAYLQTDQAEVDLQAYLDSMNVINNNAAGDSSTVSNLLINGFDDEELVSIIEAALKNN